MSATTFSLTADASQRQHAALPHRPQHSDIAIMQKIRTDVHQYIGQSRDGDAVAPHTTYLSEPGGRTHRIVLVNGAALRGRSDLTFVGFFGQRRPQSDLAFLEALDDELIQEFRHHPLLLSYNSLELADGSWANLVLMSNTDGISHWAKSPRHAYASQNIAPAYYSSIRLYNGVLHGGTDPSGALQVVQSRLFDFGRGARGLGDQGGKAGPAV